MILSEQFRATQAIVDTDAIAHNVQVLRNLCGKQNFLCPMVKANGYGHGDRAVSSTLALKTQVDAIGVNLVEEGIHIREVDYHGRVLYFGCTDRHGLEACLEWQLTPVIANWESLEQWIHVVQKKPVSFHLKFDTGMNRLGFAPADAILLREILEQTPGLIVEGIMTHLHSAEGAIESYQDQTWEQLRVFHQMADVVDPKRESYRHGFNSAGLMSAAALQREKRSSERPEWISRTGARPGLAIYGVSPFDGDQANQFSLKPAMSLHSKLVQVKKIFRGEGVSYGQRFKAAKDMYIGLVPVGYADGIKRNFSPHGKVYVAGQPCPVVGSVCMDFLMVDLSPIAEASEGLLGREVTFFGYDSMGQFAQSIEEVAKQSGVIPWELVTGLSERVPRHFKGVNQ